MDPTGRSLDPPPPCGFPVSIVLVADLLVREIKGSRRSTALCSPAIGAFVVAMRATIPPRSSRGERILGAEGVCCTLCTWRMAPALLISPIRSEGCSSPPFYSLHRGGQNPASFNNNFSFGVPYLFQRQLSMSQLGLYLTTDVCSREKCDSSIRSRSSVMFYFVSLQSSLIRICET